MARLVISKKPFSRTEYYDGVYITDVSDTDDEAQIRNYQFTIDVNSDMETDMVTLGIITWIDGEPPAIDVAEDKIRENFFDLTI